MNTKTSIRRHAITAADRAAVLAAIGLAAIAGHAAQPPDSVQSDGSGNTAMGS